MGKYKGYKNRLEMYLSSEKGKRVLNFLYSWGAAIVIIGALFKLLHLPYANQILFVAMLTEAFVFFLSAFEHPSSEYNWEEVFPVLKSKNPLDRPEFTAAGAAPTVVFQGGAANLGGSTVVVNREQEPSKSNHVNEEKSQVANGSSVEKGVSYTQPIQQVEQPSSENVSPPIMPQANIGAMGINISEQDAETFAKSVKKMNNVAEQMSKMADMTDATQSYIDQISAVSSNLEKFNEITGSLGEMSNTLANSCKAFSGQMEDGTEENVKTYAENMSQLNQNLSGLNRFYEEQLSGLRTQMDTIQHINSGLNRIRDMYDNSVVDSTAFRNENERMAQSLAQLNQVYGRLLQAMTVNMQAGSYPPPPPVGQQGYPQPPYQGGNYR